MEAAIGSNQSLNDQITWKAWDTEEVITKQNKISKPKRLKKHTGTVAKCMKRLIEKDIKNSNPKCPRMTGCTLVPTSSRRRSRFAHYGENI